MLGRLSNPDPLLFVSMIWDGVGVSLSTHDDVQPPMLIVAKVLRLVRNALRWLEGVEKLVQLFDISLSGRCSAE